VPGNQEDCLAAVEAAYDQARATLIARASDPGGLHGTV
jgi:hypothetical protein